MNNTGPPKDTTTLGASSTAVYNFTMEREEEKKSLPEVSTRSDKLISHSQRLILYSDNHDRRFLLQKEKKLDLTHKSKRSKTIKIQKKHNIPFSPLTEFVIMHLVLCRDKYANVI